MSAATGTLERSDIERMVEQVLRAQLAGTGGTGGTGSPISKGPASANWADGAPRPPASTSRQYAPSSHNGGANPLVVNVSARHIHVTQHDLEVLFGPGSKLTKFKDLYQSGEFASEQTVNIVGPRNRMIPNVRILGPCRDYSQVELSYTDGVYLGIRLPLRISGNHEGTPGCVLVGPAGALQLGQGVIRAERHVHMHPEDLSHFSVGDGDYMALKIEGPCGLKFDRVRVRQHPRVKLEVHIDTDEGNACDLGSATRMELIHN